MAASPHGDGCGCLSQRLAETPTVSAGLLCREAPGQAQVELVKLKWRLVEGDDCDDARTAELRRPAVNGTRRDAGGARADGDGLLGQGPPNQLGQRQEAALGRSNDMWDALGPPLHGPDVAGGRARGETDHIVAAATAASRSRSSLAPSRPSASAGCRPLDAAGGLGLRAAAVHGLLAKDDGEKPVAAPEPDSAAVLRGMPE